MVMFLRRIHTPLKNYFEEERKVKRQIYSVLTELNDVSIIVDIGCGDSTKDILLTTQNTFVICVDIRLKMNTKFRKRLEIIIADAKYLPLRDSCCSIATFIFTLHEINPQTHRDVILEAQRVAKYIVIAEPSPRGVKLYKRFWQTYRNAVKSIGLFEDYKPKEYWTTLLKRANLQILINRIIEWKIATPKEILENIIENIVEEWKHLGIKHTYIESIKNILSSNKEFKWSNIFLLVGVKAANHSTQDTNKSNTSSLSSQRSLNKHQEITHLKEE